MRDLNWWLGDIDRPRRDGSSKGGNPDGETTSPNAAVLARGDNFDNALQVYGQGAKDMVGNIGGPIGATSGAMGFAQEMIDIKARLARIDNRIAQGPRASGRTLMEIESALRSDQATQQHQEQLAALDLKEQGMKTDAIGLASEALTTAIGINKGLRAITKGAGDLEEAYNEDEYKAAFKQKVDELKANGFDNLPHLERLKLLDKANSEALEIAAGKPANELNTFARIANRIASGIEAIPGMAALRRKNIAAAKQERMLERLRMTPEHTKVIKEMNEQHYKKIASMYEANSPQADIEMDSYLNALEATLAYRHGILASGGDWLGDARPDVRSWFIGDAPGMTGTPEPAPVTINSATGEVQYGFNSSTMGPLITVLAEGENEMFRDDPFNAYNQGTAGDALKTVLDASGRPVLRQNGVDAEGKPKMVAVKRVVPAEEVWGKKLTQMTVGEVYGHLQRGGSDAQRMGASGFFQITKAAMDDAIRLGIVSPGDMYDRDTQTKLGVWTLTDKRPAIKAYLESENPTREMRKAAIDSLAQEYESFPTFDTGESYYGRGRPARVALQDAVAALEQSRVLTVYDRSRRASNAPTFDAVREREARYILDRLGPHKDKDFVRRILFPLSSPKIVVKGPDGREVTKTHRMAYGEIKEGGKTKYALYPEIMPEAEVERDFNRPSTPADRPKLVDYAGDGGPEGRKKAWEEAKRRGEYIVFDEEDEAAWLAQNYKTLWRGRR